MSFYSFLRPPTLPVESQVGLNYGFGKDGYGSLIKMKSSLELKTQISVARNPERMGSQKEIRRIG